LKKYRVKVAGMKKAIVDTRLIDGAPHGTAFKKKAWFFVMNALISPADC